MNFTISELKKHYVVYLTMYKGDLLPTWYIGSTFYNKIKNGYNGSVCSKKYKSIYLNEQRENKHLFKTRILSYHETREEALREELRLQKLHKVVFSNKYINEGYAQPNGFFGRRVSPTPEMIRKGLETRKRNNYKVSEETRKRISRAKKGNPTSKLSEEHKVSVSKAHLGKRDSAETRLKKSKAHVGRKISNETKEKIGKANGKIYNVFDNEGNLVLKDVRKNSDEYCSYNFPLIFPITALNNNCLYEKSKNMMEKYKKYKHWYMREVI